LIKLFFSLEIRNSRKEHKSLLDGNKDINKVSSACNLNDLPDVSNDSTGKLQVLESTMNQENLNYVNNLIKETEKTALIRPKSINSKANPFQKKTNPVKVNINLENNENSEPKAQKLFDNFFRFKENLSQETPEIQRQNNEKPSLDRFSADKQKKSASESNSSKETQNTKIIKNNTEFLKSIDECLLSLSTNEKEIGTAYFSLESEKKSQNDLLKEISSLKAENKNLKMKNEKFENKIKENSNAKRVFLQEYNMLKLKEEENLNLVKFLQQEILKMKSHLDVLKFKLKVTQESLVKEKIEAENSMIALKRVLFK